MNCLLRDFVQSGEVEIKTGPFGTQLKASEYVERGTPVLNVKNLGYSTVVKNKLDRVGSATLERLNVHILHRGDIVFGRKGAVDRHAYIGSEEEGWMQGSDCIRVRVKTQRINPRYLSYYFLTPKHRAFMIGMCSHGTTMASLNQKILEMIEIPLPDRIVQDRIVTLLESLDEKLKTNFQINDNLLEMLQTIYQQRFNNSEQKAKYSILSDICNYSKDRVGVSSLSLSSYYSTENMLPDKAGAVEASGLPTIAQTTRCKAGDVLISNIRPYFKKIVYCQSECGCSADVLCFTPKTPELSAYLYSTLYADRFFNFFEAGSKGTKMPRGDKQQIMTYPIYVPSNNELRTFNAIALPILSHIEDNRIENARLSSLRDALLPKLMSGEIDVSNIQ